MFDTSDVTDDFEPLKLAQNELGALTAGRPGNRLDSHQELFRNGVGDKKLNQIF